ncbi:MAG: PilZ domain-containing protein [Myxococcota bacterium]
MVAPTACLVDPTDILAHLFFAVGTRDEVLVSHPEGDFPGLLGNPDGAAVSLTPIRLPPRLPAGTPLCLEHVGADETYHFYSEVMAAGPEEVRIRVPLVIERTERRLCERVSLPPDAGVAFRPHDAFGALFPVYDMSSAGMGLHATVDLPLALGQVLHGELCLPDGEPVPMSVEVRHVQSRRGARCVGVRIAAVPLAGRGRLARVLLAWSR